VRISTSGEDSEAADRQAISLWLLSLSLAETAAFVKVRIAD
jgi:hypothetical protein